MKLLTVVFLVVFAVYFVACGVAANDCEDRGGRFVRGVVWYECVEPLP